MSRLVAAWRSLAPERRLAAVLALGLFASMFLPWYSKTDTVVVRGAAKATEASLSAFQAFSFVEAAVLLVSAAVLVLLFARAEGHRFQVPGGDGLMLMLAGGWAALLIFYRTLDKPGLHGTERVTATVGVEWGIFVALLLALALVAAGRRMRAEERPEPPLRRRRPPAPSAQLLARRRTTSPARAAERRAASGERFWEEPPRWSEGDETAAVPSAPSFERRQADSREHEQTAVVPAVRAAGDAPAADTDAARRSPAPPLPARPRPRYPPAPRRPASAEQLSFEEPPTGGD